VLLSHCPVEDERGMNVCKILIWFYNLLDAIKYEVYKQNQISEVINKAVPSCCSHLF
jgi:hypothetical protein